MTCLNFNTPLPGDHDLVAWSYDPAHCVNSSVVTGGNVYLLAVYLRRPAQISKVWLPITVAAVTPTSGQNFAGVYNSAGKLAGVSADISGLITTGGLYGVSLVAPFAAAAGMYWTAFVFNAATPPTIPRGAGISFANVFINANLPVNKARYAINGTGQTSLPSSIDPNANTTPAAALPFWTAVS